MGYAVGLATKGGESGISLCILKDALHTKVPISLSVNFPFYYLQGRVDPPFFSNTSTNRIVAIFGN